MKTRANRVNSLKDKHTPRKQNCSESDDNIPEQPKSRNTKSAKGHTKKQKVMALNNDNNAIERTKEPAKRKTFTGELAYVGKSVNSAHFKDMKAHLKSIPKDAAPVVLDKSSLALKQMISAPSGKCVSGRFWKGDDIERKSNIYKVKPLRKTFEERMKTKSAREAVKNYEKEIKQDRSDRMEVKRSHQAQKRKQKKINERRGEIIQVISNSTKLKKIKKKHWKSIAKRDPTFLHH